MNNLIFGLFLLLLLRGWGSPVAAQSTRVLGTITDSITGAPLPLVSIALKGTSTGTSTDFEGSFSLESNENADTLLISSIGYYNQTIAIKKGQFQEVFIELVPKNITLNEVIILPGENPAEILLKKVLAKKDEHNPDKEDFYDVDVYNKVQIDANNIEDMLDGRSMRKFQWISEYIDTSIVNGKVYLPIFFTESVSKLYYRGSPKSKREFIEAARISGVENESVAQYLGNMYQNVNFYDNLITLFDKNFVSPIAGFGLAYYKYYLVDSSYIDSDWCYKVMFRPRRKQELTFSGEMWINDSSFAIKQYEMRIVPDANVNFINDMIIEQHFTRGDSGRWMLSKEKLLADFNVFQKNQKGTLGFYGHKTTSYENYVFNNPQSSGFYSHPERVVVADDAYEKPESYWENVRHDTLSSEEQDIYTMVDSVTQMPVFRTWQDLVFLFTTGYYIWGNFEIGPYASMVSFNDIEGTRFRFGGRTSNKFSKKIMPSAYIAYGTKDETFKYGSGFTWMVDKKPRRVFDINYKHDMEQLGMSSNGFREDYILASLLSRNATNKLTLVDELKLNYSHEWFSGFSNSIRFMKKDIFPIGDTVFNFGENGNNLQRNQVRTSEISIGMRFAYKEKYVYGEFDRSSLGTTYPILQTSYSLGIKDLWGADFSYQRLNVNIEDWFNVGALGWSKYVIDAGKIWETLPYPFLKLHEGNETYFLDAASFNTMNYFEFVSDEWVSLYYTHRFDGLFLNRIPLLKKLKWREVIWGKGLIGRLSDKNKDYSQFPEGMYTLNKPYFEAGAGIDNIFKILRVDAVWRLSYLDHPDIAKFHIMFGLEVYF
ncbi:MAG: carboxypeptidase-like regulatory domain-containing protein [Bacteroidales bacterium]|nr:carboxypeptidase-like regulatory domain-containing protein [Bacteroidales bacterium]